MFDVIEAEYVLIYMICYGKWYTTLKESMHQCESRSESESGSG